MKKKPQQDGQEAKKENLKWWLRIEIAEKTKRKKYKTLKLSQSQSEQEPSRTVSDSESHNECLPRLQIYCGLRKTVNLKNKLFPNNTMFGNSDSREEWHYLNLLLNTHFQNQVNLK